MSVNYCQLVFIKIPGHFLHILQFEVSKKLHNYAFFIISVNYHYQLLNIIGLAFHEKVHKLSII